MNTMQTFEKKIILFIPLCVFLFFIQCSVNVQEDLEKHAEKENARYPIKLEDGMTVLDTCEALPNKTLRYGYTINTIKLMVDTVEIKKKLTPKLQQTIRVDQGTMYFKKHGVTFQYQYKDKAGQYVCRINITPADYAK